MRDLKIKKADISIDSQGRVIIENKELKKRVEAFLSNPKALDAHDPAVDFLDNCDCECGKK